ncbi:MAG: amidohydrolase [SAR202 cluster bacterium]|nr:amidohydrolase [SAR202 cluster bacterium]
MIEAPVISSDSHVVEPPNLWTERMDKKTWGDRIPHLQIGDKVDRWMVNGQGLGAIGTTSSAGKRYTQPQTITLEGKFARDTVPGGYDPHAHMKDIQSDGVSGDFLYASTTAGFYGLDDSTFVRAAFKAYNHWLADFCKPFPGGLNGIGIVLLDMEDIPASIADLQYVANLGLKGAMIPTGPKPGQDYGKPDYEPFWAAAQDIGLPLSLHLGTVRPGNAKLIVNGKVVQTAVDRCNNDFPVRFSLGHLIISGVFERFPKLRVANVEHELSWLPFFMHRMDVTYIERPTQATYRYKESMTPSDYMRRNVWHSFQEDGPGIRLRDVIGVTQIMWGNDYPHAESTFPRSREVLSEILAGVPEDEQALIVSGNVRRLYSK